MPGAPAARRRARGGGVGARGSLALGSPIGLRLRLCDQLTRTRLSELRGREARTERSQLGVAGRLARHHAHLFLQKAHLCLAVVPVAAPPPLRRLEIGRGRLQLFAQPRLVARPLGTPSDQLLSQLRRLDQPGAHGEL